MLQGKKKTLVSRPSLRVWQAAAAIMAVTGFFLPGVWFFSVSFAGIGLLILTLVLVFALPAAPPKPHESPRSREISHPSKNAS